MEASAVCLIGTGFFLVVVVGRQVFDGLEIYVTFVLLEILYFFRIGFCLCSRFCVCFFSYYFTGSFFCRGFF